MPDVDTTASGPRRLRRPQSHSAAGPARQARQPCRRELRRRGHAVREGRHAGPVPVLHERRAYPRAPAPRTGHPCRRRDPATLQRRREAQLFQGDEALPHKARRRVQRHSRAGQGPQPEGRGAARGARARPRLDREGRPLLDAAGQSASVLEAFVHAPCGKASRQVLKRRRPLSSRVTFFPGGWQRKATFGDAPGTDAVAVHAADAPRALKRSSTRAPRASTRLPRERCRFTACRLRLTRRVNLVERAARGRSGDPDRWCPWGSPWR